MPHDPAEELISLMFAFGKFLRGHVERRGNASACSPIQLKALYVVAEKGEPTMKDIADYFGITQPSATVLINKLVRSREIQRVTDKGDRRVVRVRITPHGRRTLEKGFKSIAHNIKKDLAKLSGSERARFTAILKKLIK